jgi:hypothetical protein
MSSRFGLMMCYRSIGTHNENNDSDNENDNDNQRSKHGLTMLLFCAEVWAVFYCFRGTGE